MTSSATKRARQIFICYRHEDAHPAGRLFDRLTGFFGRDSVFLDTDSIQPGDDDYIENIMRGLDSCAVLLLLIGRLWLTVTDEDGRRRIDDPNDVLRLEIEAALERGIRVIPILIDGIMMPRPAQLPTSLQDLKLANRQAFELSWKRFDSDASQLLEYLKNIIAEPLIGSSIASSDDAENSQRGIAPVDAYEDHARTSSLRLNLASSLIGYMNELYDQAVSGDGGPRYTEAVNEIYDRVQGWIGGGFEVGEETWCERALNSFHLNRNAAPYAEAEFNRIKVEIRAQFAGLDDVLSSKVEDVWQRTGTILKANFGSLLADVD